MPESNTQSTSGTLSISAFSVSQGRPAPGVRITVSEPGSGETIADGTTNSEGLFDPLILPAPPQSYSLTPPDQTGSGIIYEEPFSSYDIVAVAPGGETTRIDGAQVYSDIVSRQRIIIPGQDNDIYVLQPAIMGGFPEKIPESETKKLPTPGGNVVLPQTVVPGLVVVHDGVPTDNTAPNYTLEFREYIKNVACSEIFATWPSEAIRANVIAIISFTLNRVYTEWYRNKGYDFTITSSTAFDQAFVYGRTIFSDVSDIVDEVFNLYISREGMSQPLLAQYCDGIRVRRSGWLSQWGSKELADQGLSAFQILRSYYGRNIVLREAQRVEGIPMSFRGVQKFGSTGEAVRTIQNQLNGISDNYPLIQKLAVDGIFGRKTEEAVKTFQRIFGLPVNGIVNFGTWYAISDIYVAVKKLAERE